MSGSPLKIGVVAVTYNASRIIDGFLRSLLAQTHSDFILYVTDNASSDRTLEQVGRYPDPRIRVFRNSGNLGWAEAANRGILAALADDCSLVLLMNDDTEFGPQLLERLVTGLDDYQCHMIVPKIVFFDNQRVIWSAGGTFKSWKGYAPSHHGVFQIDHGQFDSPRQVEHGPACCLLVRREVFDRIGVLDRRFFLCLDDADLCYRAMRAGFKLYYLPSATVLHKVSSSTGGLDSETNAWYGTRSHVIYLLKHLGVWQRLVFLPAYQIHMLLKLVTGRMKMTRFLLREKAFFDGLRVWRETGAGVKQSLSCQTS